MDLNLNPTHFPTNYPSLQVWELEFQVHECDLKLENRVGKKVAHIKVNVIGRPSAPEGPLKFDDMQANSVRVSWTTPKDNGGTEILGYIVERRESSRVAWYTVDTRVVDTHLLVKGLQEGVKYHFKVTAENQYGVSESLKSDEPIIPKTPLCEYIFNSIYQFFIQYLQYTLSNV